MSRMLATLAFLLCSVAVAGADESRVVTIRWFGQSFFQIESSRGTRVAIDPHMIEGYGRRTVPADVVLITHLHNDHTQMDAIQNKAKAKVLLGLRPNEATRRL